MKSTFSSSSTRRVAPFKLNRATRAASVVFAAALGGLALLATAPRAATAQNYVYTDLTPPFLGANPPDVSAFPFFDFYFGGANRAALVKLIGSGSTAADPGRTRPFALLDLFGSSAVDLTPTFLGVEDSAYVSNQFGHLLLGDSSNKAIIWTGLSGALASDLTPAFLGDSVSSSSRVNSGFDLNAPRFVGSGNGPNTNSDDRAVYWGGPSKAAAVNIHPAFLSNTGTSEADSFTENGVILGQYDSEKAVLWTTPSPGSAVSMHPSFAGVSGYSDIDYLITGTKLLGQWHNGDFNYRPVIWTAYSDTAALDLTPALLGANAMAEADALSFSTLYGYGKGDATGGRNRALYWSAHSKASAVDITPTFLGASTDAKIEYSNNFLGMANPLLFGEGFSPTTGNKVHALIWKGVTAASAVDMTPAFLGASPTSSLAVSSVIRPNVLTPGGPPAAGSGAGASTGDRSRAIAWTSTTAASAIDLNPTFVDAQGNSYGENAWGNVITGSWTSPTLGGTQFFPNSHAVLWRGLTKSSAVDLHLQLPVPFRTQYPTSRVILVDYDGNVFGRSTDPDTFDSRSWVLKPVGLTSRQVGAGSDNRGRLLWNHSDGRVYLMSVNDANGALAPSVALTNVPGYTARAFTQGKVDGKTRLLLTTPTGAAKVQTIGANQTTLEATYTFSAPAGYRFTDISVGNDNKVRLLLSNVNGAAAVWRLGLTGAIEIGTVYGPYQGYVPGGIATGTDNKTRIAYVYGEQKTKIAYHTLGVNGALESGVVVNAPLYYSYGDFALGSDNKARILWNSYTGGCAVWRMNAGGSAPEIGKVYGAITGYSPRGLAVSPNGVTRLLWKNYDRRNAYWTLDANLNVTQGYTFGPYN